MTTKATDFYYLCLVKIEKNGTNDNVSLDYSRFVILAKSAFIKFVELTYANKSDDELRYIQNLLVTTKLEKNKTSDTFTEFSLPNDYFNHSSIKAKAKTSTCKEDFIELYEVKDLDNDAILNDEFNKPSFKHREAPYTFSNNNVRVFTDGEFDITKVDLTYYRYPNYIRLIDEENPEEGIEDEFLDFDDKALEKISAIIARDFDINTSNPRFQTQEYRINK